MAIRLPSGVARKVLWMSTRRASCTERRTRSDSVGVVVNARVAISLAAYTCTTTPS